MRGSERTGRSGLGRRQVLSLVMALVMWPAALFLELALLMREKFIGPEQPAATDTIDQLRPDEEARHPRSTTTPVEPRDE